MRGHSQSGALLWFSEDVVYKRASGSAGDRLQEQHEKMLRWPVACPKIRVPRVSLSLHQPFVQLEVERVKGVGLALACSRWEQHLAAIMQLLYVMFAESRKEDVRAAVITKARSSAEAATSRGHDVRPINQAVERIAALVAGGCEVPIGPCHGDLSLSNVLCDCATSEGSVAVIDLIEPFVSSPLLDLVKLRQDTKHGWISNHVEGVSTELLKSADDVLVRAFSGASWCGNAYRPMQILNLLRILPYVDPGPTSTFLFDQMGGV